MNPREIVGRYYPSGSSNCLPASLVSDGQYLKLDIDGAPQLGRCELAGVSDYLARVPRKVTFIDGSVFETMDNDGVDEMFDKKLHFARSLTAVESSYKLVALIAVLTVVTLFSIYRFGLPMAAKAAAVITPNIIVELIDVGTLPTVDKILFHKSKLSAERKAELTELFSKLSTGADTDGLKLRLLFRDGGALGANAIALPGGTIILTDQLAMMAKSTDEIAGVFAHEIGHVVERHSLQQLYRILGVAAIVTVIAGDSGQIVEDIVTQAAALQNFSYSKKFETGADIYSARLMLSKGRNPLAFIDLLGRITKDDGTKKESNWLATHPGTFNRAQAVKEAMKKF